MTSWPEPGFFPMNYPDGVTGATALAMIKHHFGELPTYGAMLSGKMGGSLGEVSAIALIIGLLYMLWRKIITWHIPVSIVLTVAVFTGILHIAQPAVYAHPFLHVLSGGLLLGAIFMATDYVTSPMTKKGMVIYGVGIGVITVVIRLFGAYPEGMSFAILIMNAFTPLINSYVKPKRFGETVKNG
jgi:electron transport complex protein RnfD